MVKIEKIEVDIANEGHITNTYIIYDESKQATLIDPGYDSMKIISKIKELQLNVQYIVITHGHGDHIGALEEVQNYTNSKVIVHKKDKDLIYDMDNNYSEMLQVDKQNLDESNIIQVEDKYEFKVGKMTFEIVHTPGHTAGCICVLEKESKSLFTGDTIFCDCYGRCDLYSGDFNVMVDSIKKLFSRFHNIMIYPGHDKIVNIESSKRKIKMLLAIHGVNI